MTTSQSCHHSSVPPDDSPIGLLGPRACWPSPLGPSSPQTQQLQHDCHPTPPQPTAHLPLLCHHALSSQVRSSITPSCSSTSIPSLYSDSPSPPLPPPFPKWSPQTSLHPNPAWPRSRQPLQLTLPQKSPLPPTPLCASSPLSLPVSPSPYPTGLAKENLSQVCRWEPPCTQSPLIRPYGCTAAQLTLQKTGTQNWA